MYLSHWMEKILKNARIGIVIETGTETGVTSEWFAARRVTFTCDVQDKRLPSVKLIGDNRFRFWQGSSVEFLGDILPNVPDFMPVLFYLDAHEAPAHCALWDELGMIARHRRRKDWSSDVIVIHDFQVPDRPDFGFDTYDGRGPLRIEACHDALCGVFESYKLHYNRRAVGACRGVVAVQAERADADISFSI